MSQLKYYNVANAAWEPAIVGAQGATGPAGAIGNTLTSNLDANGYNISNAGNIDANYFNGVASNVNVESVNNNYSYHMVFVTGNGDTTLHMDGDDDFQYNPADGTITVNRIDPNYLNVHQSVVSNLNPFSNVTQDLGNTTNRWKDIYLANSTIYLGDATLSANGNSIVVDSITVTNGNVGTVGNIASLNLDGSSSNVLYGNGVFAPAAGGGGAVISNGTSYANVVASDGNVVIGVNNDNMTWTFATDRKIYGLTDEDVSIVAVNDGSDPSVYQQIVDNSLALVSQTRLEVGDFSIGFNLDGNANIWRFDNDSLRPPANGSFEQYDGNIRMFAMDAGSNPVASLQSVSNQNDPNIFTTIDATTTGANISVYNGGSVGGTGYTWRFDNTGNLTLAGGNSVIFSTANSSLDPTNPNVSTMTFTPDANYNSQVLVLDPTAPGHIHLRAYAFSNIDEPAANIFLGGENTAFEITQGANNVAKIHSGGNTWTFTANGDIQLASGNSVISSLPNNAGDLSGLSTLNLYPDSSTGDDRYLILDPTGPGHLHLRAGGNIDASTALLYLGGEQTYVQIDDGFHHVSINTYDSANATGYNWRFSNNGTLVLPGNTFAVNYANGTQVPIVSSASGSNNQIQFNSNGAFGASANYTFTDTVGGGSVEVGNELLLLGNGTISTASNNLNIQPAGNLVVTASAYNWTFDIAGNLTLPGNTFAVNYANGTQVSLGGGGSYGDSNVTTLLGSFGSNSIVTTGNIDGGNILASGTSSTVVRRAFGLVAFDTEVQLDDLYVSIDSGTTQLKLRTSGSWQGTGWTETFAGGQTTQSWINLPLNPGFNTASGSLTSQGNGCKCVISDQTPTAKMYEITVVRSGTTGSQFNISIERLV